MSWAAYVKPTTDLGFSKVTIINRQNYQTLACTAAGDIATAWADGDKQVNENQELLDDWKDAKKTTFCFFGKRYNILLRDDEDGNWIVCLKGKEVCVAYQFKSIWFIAYGVCKSKNAKKEDPGFKGAPDAFNKISKDVWDALVESGV